MATWLRDLRFTLRRLAATPGFTAATLLTLALGIGANTAIFTVINSVLLKPLPFAQPEQLIVPWQSAPGINIEQLNPSLADYVTWREHSRTLSDIAIWNGRALTISEFTEPERVQSIAATHRLLPMLGVNPILGRHFTAKDDEDSSPRVALITYAWWRSRFGGDPNVVGRRIKADGGAIEIIGVLPQNFWFMDQPHSLLVPIRFTTADIRLGGYNFQGIARLRPDATIATAKADFARMIKLTIERYPAPGGFSKQMFLDARLTPNPVSLRDDLIGDISRSLWVVMATIGIVLLIACANVANLLLVRMEGRAQEFAVRTALGASRSQIAATMLSECLTLAMIGGAIGIAFASSLIWLIIKLAPTPLPRMEHISIDATSLLFTVVLSLLAGLTLAAIPVLKYTGRRLNESLRAGGRSATASRSRHLATSALTAFQVALALTLLIGSGLMIRTFISIRGVHPGFTQFESLQTLRVIIPNTTNLKAAETIQTMHNLMDRVAAIPGVTSVGLMDGPPLTGFSSNDPIYASNRTYRPDELAPLRRFIRVAPGAFTTLNTPLLAGRDYTWTDIHQMRQLAIISENFAREYFGSPQGAIGKQIRVHNAEPWSEIIGVVGDIRHDGCDKKAPTIVYWPIRDQNVGPLLVRTSRAGTEGLITDLRAAIREVNAGAPVTAIETMQHYYTRSMARTSFTLVLLGISGAMALLLAIIGVYAVISYTISQRTKEIGIRVALGAAPSSLTRMFVSRGLLWAGLGAVAGLAVSAALSQLMTSLLYEVSPLDPVTFLAAPGTILLAAALASYVPARRAAGVDPMEALRAD